MSGPAKNAKGRGAADNPQGRFETLVREAAEEFAGKGTVVPATRVLFHPVRSIISRNQSPDVPFSQSINPYQGCEHGCIYCYARPSHSYLGLSPGLDFETKIFAKPEAAALLRRELAHPKYRCEVISLGANTDPYQPVERQLGITREILETLRDFRHPVGVVSKSSLVERDIDILAPMAEKGLARVFISIDTLDPEIARKLEPRAVAPLRRIETLRRLSAAGIPCGTLVAPVIPFLNDKDMERVLETAQAAGATMAGYVMLRLPNEVRELFKAWLERHYPLKAAHVMARVRDVRGGRESDPRFGSRMTGEGLFAEMIRKRFDNACRRLGLNDGKRNGLDTSKFRVPEQEQMPLL